MTKNDKGLIEQAIPFDLFCTRHRYPSTSRWRVCEPLRTDRLGPEKGHRERLWEGKFQPTAQLLPSGPHPLLSDREHLSSCVFHVVLTSDIFHP